MFILLFHLLLYSVVVLNIPILRQFVVFIYLSFIPGLLIFKLLHLGGLSLVEQLLLSVGLSIAFLMFVGLLINSLFSALNISFTSFFSAPLLGILTILTLLLTLISFRKTSNLNFNLEKYNLNEVLLKSTFLLPLIFGVFGSLYSNIYLMVLMILSVAILYFVSVFIRKFSSFNSLVLIIFCISIALIFQVVLTSPNIMGFDVNYEFYVFKITLERGYWAPISAVTNEIAAVNYNSMLSVTILPTIYYSLMNTSGEIIFKSIYPFIFSLVPVTLFSAYFKQLGKKAALISVLFYMSGVQVFYGFEPLSLSKQIVGLFFLSLSVLIILNKNISINKRRLLIIVFAGAMVVSHYSLTLIYLFILILFYIACKIKHYDSFLNIKTLSLIYILSFSWFFFAGNSILLQITQCLSGMITRFTSDFTRISSRVGVLSGSHPAFGSDINFAGTINYTLLILAYLFIAIGFITVLFGFLKKQKNWPHVTFEYRILCIIAGLILFLCLAIPNLAPALNFTRFFAITSLFIAPCFVIGGKLIIDVANLFYKKISRKDVVYSTRSLSI